MENLSRTFADLENAIYWIKYGATNELERLRRFGGISASIDGGDILDVSINSETIGDIDSQ